jgi:hypothetical protein
MTDLDEIAKLLGSNTASVISTEPVKKKVRKERVKKPAKAVEKKETAEVKEAESVKTAETAAEENIEEKIAEEKNKIEEKAAEQTTEEKKKEQEEIDKDYIDPLSEDYKRKKNNIIGRKILQ